MNLDKHAVRISLTDIERVERRTVRAVLYGRSGAILVLWGILVAGGYLLNFLKPSAAPILWPAVWIAGLIGMSTLLFVSERRAPAGDRLLQWRIIAALLTLIGFGHLTVWLLEPLTGRQLGAFWPLVFMLGYVIAGLWVGRFFIACGGVVAGLTIAGYLWSGDLFLPWMAVTNGGGLVLGGLWLRHVGARP